MRKVLVLLLAVSVMITLSASLAEAKPKHFYQDKYWWAGVAVIAAGEVADGYTASRAVGTTLADEDPFIGSSITVKQINIIEGARFIAMTGLHAASYEVMRKDPSKAWRVASKIDIPAISLTGSLYGTAANLHVCSISGICK